MRSPGEKCGCCRPDEAQTLILVRGAVVCPKCDNVHGWPKKVNEA